jgi:hypothetical protein
MTSRWLLVPVLLGACLVAGVSAQDQAARSAAASMQRKLIAIAAEGERPPTARRSTPLRRTSFTDHEVNAFFKMFGPTFMPAGVNDPQVAIDEGGRVRARAIVDLDTALKPKERSWLDPLAWLSGKVEVTAMGTLRADAGKGLFALEQATLGGVSVPKSVLQELVSYYSRTPEQPKGLDLDQPFDLPSKIQSVETRRGLATVVQ